MKKIYYLLLLILFITTSCQSMKEAGSVLRNEKKATTDEFLIKKKQPLVLPPDYEKVPEPDSISKNEISEEKKLKQILKAPNVENSKKTSSSFEERILEKIRK